MHLVQGSSAEIADIDSKLRLSTLNTAKTAYASFVLDSGKFFSKYSFSARGGQSSSGQRYVDKFACQMYLKVIYFNLFGHMQTLVC